jgi:hypothetical protein
MPSTWGSSPEEDNSYAGNDIPQYTKFFDLHDMDFEMRRVSGLWDVLAWTRGEDDVWAVSKKFESLGDAFNSCYTEVKKQMRLLSPEEN